MRVDPGTWRAGRAVLAGPGVALVAYVLSLQPLLAQDCPCEPVPWWAWWLVTASCAPLVVRRRWPFTASLIAGMLAFAYGISSLPDPPVQYAGAVALYSAAAHASLRLARVAGVIAPVAIAVALAIDYPDADLQDATTNYAVFATAWLLGWGVRTRREQARQLAARAVTAERTRIARELHDIVAHHVSLMVVQAEAGPVVIRRDPERAAAAFDAISATGKTALVEMRRLLGVLREGEGAPAMAPQPGTDQVPELIDGVRAAGLDVSLEITGDPRPLPPAVDLSAYRVLQEALTNALRHGAHSGTRATLRYELDAVRVEVLDRGAPVTAGRGGGPGVATGPAGALSGGGGAGSGLIAMRERVSIVGGSLEAGPGPDGGWDVRAVLPAPGNR